MGPTANIFIANIPHYQIYRKFDCAFQLFGFSKLLVKVKAHQFSFAVVCGLYFISYDDDKY